MLLWAGGGLSQSVTICSCYLRKTIQDVMGTEMRADKWNTRRRDFPIGRDITKKWWSDLEWGQGGGQMIKSESKCGLLFKGPDQTDSNLTSFASAGAEKKGSLFISWSSFQRDKETTSPAQRSDMAPWGDAKLFFCILFITCCCTGEFEKNIYIIHPSYLIIRLYC